jgi:hypothetical protein
VEELRMHLAWRWFTGLRFDQEIPHHSTFSKNRHGRFQESKLFQQLFEQIVQQCMEIRFGRNADGIEVEETLDSRQFLVQMRKRAGPSKFGSHWGTQTKGSSILSSSLKT